MATIFDNLLTDTGSLLEPLERERIIDDYSRVTQFLTWPFFLPLFSLFLKIRVTGRENLSQLSSPFIIISNHVAIYDSFLFRLALGFATPHLPLRFMAVKKFRWKFLNILHSIGIIEIVYALFGVFTVTPGKGFNENLKEAHLIIKAGGNVVIYPEGEINKSGHVSSFKKGAAVLARQTGVQILPLSFRKGDKSLFRRSLAINIGSPMNLSKTLNDQENTDILHEKVVSLYNVKHI